LVLVERLALRLGLFQELTRAMPRRAGHYKVWGEVIHAAVAGLLSGSRGTYAMEALREDGALLALLGMDEAPEEATFWRMLAELGREEIRAILARVRRLWVRRIVPAMKRKALLWEGFVPVFGDGSLLEGSRRREGTTYIRDKGEGLMWSTWFVGPFLVGEMLAAKGEGEQTSIRAMLPEVVEEVLEPLRLMDDALLMLDSLHGDGPTLDAIESYGLHYIIGANKLAETERVLREQPEVVWIDTGAVPERGWSESAVCVCWLQCRAWETKRVLVGRRWKREGQMIYEYAGVVTDLEEADVAHIRRRDHLTYPEAIWHLYDGKMAYENHYKDLLEDLDLHHPPCQALAANRGYYALASLAHTLARAVDLIGGASPERGSTVRLDGAPRKRPLPASMRLWRIIRRFFQLPGRVIRHARTVRVEILGVSDRLWEDFDRRFLQLGHT
jgi:hypothetical protein